MNITAAKQQIKDTVEAYLKKDDAGLFVIAPAHQRPVFLLGAPGIGKTAIMEQVASELGIGIVSYSMTHHTRQSALGLPRIEHRSFDGFEFDSSEYTMSEIVAAIYDYMERTDLRSGILFLDEINCVSETLYPSMLQFLQFKTFGKHKVPDGWVVVCAGNPPEYNRSVHEFDIVTLDRMREIDVEPDYAAWKGYATAKGLHPAVTSFLEAKKDCFYKVESKPGGGKAFVTARGWEDLAQIIALYEDMGKPVNRELIVQYLRDDDIADKFAVYYALFDKYRSDYQVDTILAGKASDAIKNRAHEAEFDERLALLSLMLDMLAHECSQALEQENVVVELRDVLRAAKPDLMGGADVADVLGARTDERERALSRKVQAMTASNELVRRERLTIAKLKEFQSRCALAGTEAGEAAFRTVETAYKEEVAKIQPLAQAAGTKMDNAFDFVDACFSSREMLVLLAELATRKPTTQFVAHYGNDKYYAYNKELQADASRMGLTERVNMLDDLERNVKLSASRTPDMGSAVGLSVGSDARENAAGDTVDEVSSAAAGGAQASAAGDTPAVGDAADAADTAVGAVAFDAEQPAAGAPDSDQLRAHYATKQFEYGFASVCRMLLPVSELKGKRVLDVGCRRGKGVFKISSMVGPEGEAIGVDWNAAYIEEAKDRMDHAWRKSGLRRNNMEFKVACPEDLIAAGIGTSTIDVLYVNNAITLFFDQAAALREFARVLKPGGLLVMETVFADRPRTEEVVRAARELGNSIQAARTQDENYAWLREAGFAEPTIEDAYAVAANRGYEAGSTVEVVPGDEDVSYQAVSLFATRTGGRGPQAWGDSRVCGTAQ